MRTLVGIRPGGRLHIGHYFSVIKPALEEKAHVLIADFHAPEGNGYALEMALKRYGILAKRQRIIFDADLYWDLMAVARWGELSRMTQFKSKKKTPHLFVYPVLMAHDVIGYDKVIVGEDQKQHLEYAKVLLKRLGAKYPKGDYRGGRVMSLTNPRKKMSKSEPKGCLFLDNPELKHAVTTPAGIKNLAYIYKQLTGYEWDKENNKIMKDYLKKAVIQLSKKEKV